MPHQQKLEYLKFLRKLWESKVNMLAKSGILDSIPEMLDEDHDLLKHTLVTTIDMPDEEKK